MQATICKARGPHILKFCLRPLNFLGGPYKAEQSKLERTWRVTLFQIPTPDSFSFTGPEDGYEPAQVVSKVNTLIYHMGDHEDDILTCSDYLMVIKRSMAVKEKFEKHFIKCYNEIMHFVSQGRR